MNLKGFSANAVSCSLKQKNKKKKNFKQFPKTRKCWSQLLQEVFCHFNCSPSFWKPCFLFAGEKPFSCDQCNKSFAHASDLTRHKIIHSGECFVHVPAVTCHRADTFSSLLLYPVQPQHFEDSDTFSACRVIFCFHNPSYRIFNVCVIFLHVFIVSFKWLFVESAQNLTLKKSPGEKSWGGCTAWHTTVTHLCGYHIWSCLAWLARAVPSLCTTNCT